MDAGASLGKSSMAIYPSQPVEVRSFSDRFGSGPSYKASPAKHGRVHAKKMTAFIPRPPSDLELSLSVAIQPSSCGRHLVRHNAPQTPFFYLGDTAWELFHRLDDAEAEMYLRNRADKGFNSIMVVVLAEHGGLDYPNREGNWPFFPAADAAPDHYVPDLSRPNPAYFAFVDRVVRLAAKMGMTITLVPTWGRYVNGGFYEKPILFDEAKAYAYGKFLGSRYPAHPFVLGGDSVRYWSPKTMDPSVNKETIDIIDYGPVWEAMAKGLIEGEHEGLRGVKGAEGYKTFITYHSCQCWYKRCPEATASAQFPDAEWLSMDCVQSGHYNGAPPQLDDNGNASQSGSIGDALELWKGGASYEPIRKMYTTLRPDGKPRPCIDLEPHYDEHTHHWWDRKQPYWQPEEIRSGAWQGVFAGAAGYTYGCNSIWQMHNDASKSHPPIAPPTTAYTNWYLELDLQGAFYASAMRRFFLSLPDFFSRRPDSSFILSDTNEPKDGSSALDKLVQGLKADTWAMVHLPYGGEVEVDLEKALSGSRYRAWWVSPASGGREVMDNGEKSDARGARTFKSPTEGALDKDWVLLLETYSE